MTGTLQIKGTISLNQFWPTSSSDADTTKIKLFVDANSFLYRPDGSSNFKKTSVFDDAVAKGQGSGPVINTSKKDGAKTITVRLQGVDAPELHYRAAPLKSSSGASDDIRKRYNELNKERRQHFAESATAALTKYLTKFAKDGIVQAVFESTVEHPYEVVDTYGRFIGNIKASGTSDINLWLVENGWCSPSFYSSMSAEEISAFISAWEKGRKLQGRTSQSLIKDADFFNENMLYREPGTVSAFTIGDDKGKTIIPKIFRRQVAWQLSLRAGITAAGTNFSSFLKQSPDELLLLKDFLAHDINSAKTRFLHDMIDSGNIILKGPEELVFKEKPGTLVNAAGDKITGW
jgi:endonuclease YncB( thermonuclease family)